MRREERLGIGYAFLATLFFASAGPVARIAGVDGALDPLGIAFWRVLLGAGFVLLLGWAGGRPPKVQLRDLPSLALYGIVLAMHFYLYIGSLFATSLDHALVLVNTAPVWAAILSWWILKEPLPAAKLPGVVAVILGMAWLVGFDPSAPEAHLRGDLMGLGAALTYALYAIAGRRDRARYPLLTYAFWVYLLAAATLGIVSPRMTFLRPVPSGSWLPVLILALLPTTFGHTLFNAAIRRIHAATANLIATQEVTGGMLLGWLILAIRPSATALMAWPLVLAGIIWVIIPRKTQVDGHQGPCGHSSP
jgi:drug/metabolite transporter (DMT)-like permease